VVNEETFKQIYAQFFPHGGESDLDKHPPGSLSNEQTSLPASPPFLINGLLLKGGGEFTARCPPFLQGVGFSKALAERSPENIVWGKTLPLQFYHCPRHFQFFPLKQVRRAEILERDFINTRDKKKRIQKDAGRMKLCL
jgi:hypothetical protein